MMGLLYDVETHTINYHLKKVFADRELEEGSVIRNFRMTAADGKSYNTKHAVQFRKWATTVIEAFTIKGFAMDDERLKSDGSFPAIKRNPPRHARMVLSGIHFSHGFPIKPSEMTVSRIRRKTERFLGGVS